MVKATGTSGYYWVVPYSRDDTLLISGDDASEMHRAFSDRETEQLYLSIAANLRDRQIVATHARVMNILNQELDDRDREDAIDQLQSSIDRLEAQTRQLKETILSQPRR